MEASNVQLVFRVRGTALDPTALTEATHVQPDRTFLVGDPKLRSKDSAGWDWRSAWSESDAPLWRELLDVLGPHRTAFRDCVDHGAVVSLTVVGESIGELIENAEQAERLNWDTEDVTYPYVGGAIVELLVPPEALAFLGGLNATMSTYIAADIQTTQIRPSG